MKISDNKFTPLKYINSVRKVFSGVIDLDPASGIVANKRIKAATIFTEIENGLNQDWFGNVWLNPPYSKSEGSSLLTWTYKIKHEW